MRKLLFLLFTLITWYLMKDNHKCKWEHCPYQNVAPIDWNQLLDQSDSRQLDSIHLMNPEMEYDQLDSTLNTIK